MRRPLFYWSDLRPGGGMPVAFTVRDGKVWRSVWTGIWGIGLGGWFIGVTRGHPGAEEDCSHLSGEEMGQRFVEAWRQAEATQTETGE